MNFQFDQVLSIRVRVFYEPQFCFVFAPNRKLLEGNCWGHYTDPFSCWENYLKINGWRDVGLGSWAWREVLKNGWKHKLYFSRAIYILNEQRVWMVCVLSVMGGGAGSKPCTPELRPFCFYFSCIILCTFCCVFFHQGRVVPVVGV